MYESSSSNSLVEYTYNDKGLKHSKTSYSGGLISIETEQLFYVYDAGGAQLATYTKLVQVPNDVYILQHHTLYAAGRVGLLDAFTGKALFELSDHLGNVRAVVTASANGAVETVSYTDYYPHGGILPARTYQSSLNFPYGYQGQEKDGATGLTNFELRQYDPRIGRWYNPDPYMQHHSPYLAMSNNPVSFTDPDGGWDGDDGYDKAMGDIMKRNNYNFLAACIEANEQMNWNGMSPSDRKTIQGMFGTSYKTQFENRVMDNIDSFGEYTERGTTYYYSEKRGLYGYWKDENTLTGAVKQFHTKSGSGWMGNHITGNVSAVSKFNRIGGDEFLTSLRFKEKLRADIRSGLKIVEAFNPASSAWDAMSMLVYGTDKYGNDGSVVGFGYAVLGAFPGGNIEKGFVQSGSDIALGLADDLFKFAETKGFQTYRDFSTGLQKGKILSVIQDGSNKLHFNLTGFSRYQYSKFNPNGIISYGNITNWELHTILNTPGAAERTTFYRYIDGQYTIVPNPFK